MHLFPFIHCNSRFLKNYILNRLIVDLGAKTSITELNIISSVKANIVSAVEVSFKVSQVPVIIIRLGTWKLASGLSLWA